MRKAKPGGRENDYSKTAGKFMRRKDKENSRKKASAVCVIRAAGFTGD